MSNRRGFLRRTLGTYWSGAALLEQSVFRAAQARAQAKPGLPALFAIEKVADGIYAAIGLPAAQINSNAAIFEMSDGLLIVDTHSKPSAVFSLVAQIRREVSPKPVKYIVNSHFHWDHTQGNAAYRKQFPRVNFIASNETHRLLSQQAALRLKGSVEETAAAIDQLKTRMSKATSAEDKKFFAGQIRESESYLTEMKGYTPELPNITVGDGLVLHDKMHDLHLIFRGRAHTSGDISVYCPLKKVIATGDMMHGFGPFIADGYPLEWPKTLRTIRELDFQHLIGGHAGVQHDKRRVTNMADYIEEVTAAVKSGREDIKAASLKSLQADGYGEFLIANSKKYTPVVPSEREMKDLDGVVKSSVAGIKTALKRQL